MIFWWSWSWWSYASRYDDASFKTSSFEFDNAASALQCFLKNRTSFWCIWHLEGFGHSSYSILKRFLLVPTILLRKTTLMRWTFSTMDTIFLLNSMSIEVCSESNTLGVNSTQDTWRHIRHIRWLLIACDKQAEQCVPK